MPVTFRTSVPAGTLPDVPARVILRSQYRAVQEFAIWSSDSDLANIGYRIFNYGGNLVIPDSGSSDGALTLLAGESRWAAIPPGLVRIDMNEELLEGPPFEIVLEFYNKSAVAVKIGGFFVVRDPLFHVSETMLYDILDRITKIKNK